MTQTHVDMQMEATTTRYVTIGSVRGWCGHRHKTLYAAEECRRRDSRGCRMQGGYSDREVWRDGRQPLSAAEREDLDAIRDTLDCGGV